MGISGRQHASIPPPWTWRGFPALSWGGEPVISPQGWPTAGRKPPGIWRPCFLPGQKPCRSSEGQQNFASHLICPAFFQNIPSCLPGSPSSHLERTSLLFVVLSPPLGLLPVPSSDVALPGPVTELASSASVSNNPPLCSVCVHWLPPPKTVSPVRAGTLCVLFTAQGLARAKR